jgi:transcription elongation factor Elf1
MNRKYIEFNCDFCNKPTKKIKKNYNINNNIRNFCSLRCSAKARQIDEYNQYIKDWLSGKVNGLNKDNETISNYIKKWIKLTKNNKCEICNWNKVNEKTGNVPVTLHHKDGNYKNNTPDNLMLLCPNCHSLTPTYGSLNMGNGRKSRKKNT